jgi:hypothetical protein
MKKLILQAQENLTDSQLKVIQNFIEEAKSQDLDIELNVDLSKGTNSDPIRTDIPKGTKF